VTIALGFAATSRTMPFGVFLRWVDLLRNELWPGPTYFSESPYVVDARNQITEQYLAGDAGALLMWDLDQIPPIAEPAEGLTLLRRLESLHDHDVVGGLYHQRVEPYLPIAYKIGMEGDRELGPVPIPWEQMQIILAKRGLYQVGSVGTGSMLIQRAVLERLGQRKGFPDNPLWEAPTQASVVRNGKRTWALGEDHRFCREARDAGYKIWLDSRWESGHLGEVVRFSRDYIREQRRHEFEAAVMKPTPRKVWTPQAN